MADVQIEQHTGATLVSLVAWRGDIWLWFTEPEGLVRQFIPAHEISEALRDGFQDAQPKALIEARMQVAGYQLRPTAIQNEDLAVWEIVA